jgi:hypothetical protein
MIGRLKTTQHAPLQILPIAGTNFGLRRDKKDASVGRACHFQLIGFAIGPLL